MTQEDAEAVARWHFPEPFSFYDWHTDDLSELLDPKLRADDFVAVDDDSGNLVGYFNYKPPHHPSLEIGLGMHPDWTGRPVGALLFTCNGRGTNMFSEPDHDARVVAEALSTQALAGFFCGGEIGPVGGKAFPRRQLARLARSPPPSRDPCR